MAGIGQAVGIEVVAEEDHGRPVCGALQLVPQGDEHGLPARRRLAGVPDQEERLGDGVGPGGGSRP